MAGTRQAKQRRRVVDLTAELLDVAERYNLDPQTTADIDRLIILAQTPAPYADGCGREFPFPVGFFHHICYQPRKEDPVSDQVSDQPRPQTRNVQQTVFDTLVQTGHAMSTDAIAARTGLAKKQANAACYHLAKKSLILKLGQGIYKAKEDPPADHRIDVNVGVGGGVRDTGIVIENQDDEITAVLDLLLPNGFRARHLGAIERWKVATRNLLDEVREG